MSTKPRCTGTASSVTLHIERLVLDGVPLARRDTAVFQRAFEAEAGRLLAAGPAGAWSDAALARLTTAPITLTANGSAGLWARQAARSLVAGLSHQVSPPPQQAASGPQAPGAPPGDPRGDTT